MPRHIEVPTLYSCSLDAFCSVLLSEEVEEIVNGSDTWPFDSYPTRMITDLMEAVVVRGIATHNHAPRNKKILFTPLIERGIVFWSADDFKVMASRCSSLTELVLCGRVGHEFSDIQLFLGKSHIQRVIFMLQNFSLTLNHSTLRCPPTIYTYVLRCFEDRLLMNKFPTSIGSAATTIELYLFEVSLTVEDIGTILSCCPQTRVLRNPKLVAALYNLNNELEEKPHYQLVNLDMVLESTLSSPDEVSAAVELCVDLCPEAAVVFFLLNDPLPLENIYQSLISLERLEALRLGCIQHSLTSNEMFYSLLVKNSNYLRSLKIGLFKGLDMKRLISSCPNLECLQLHENRFTAYSLPDAPQDNLRNLMELRVTSTFNPRMPLWRKVLVSPALVVVELYNVQLETPLLDKVMQNNYWPRLVVFVVSNCDNLESRHVVSLLQSENDLSQLSVYNCRNFMESDKITIQQYIFERNLKVAFTFRSYYTLV